MLSTAFDRLERDLAVELPTDFRNALADPAVHEAFRSVMLDANPTLWGDDAVANTVSVLHNSNRKFRESVRWVAWDDQTPSDSSRAVRDAEKPWPRHWLWVGGTFCGDAYFLDLSRDPAPVAFWSHESLTCHVEMPSFAAWADTYRRHGEACLRSKPPPLPRNPVCPKCGAELTAQKARLCRRCGGRW